MQQQSPIGIFDSGVGGTSIWREIVRVLPLENTIYLADSRNAPYGEKLPADITALSRKNAGLLVSLGCKIIVVACNTATTNSIQDLRKEFKIPFIGIEPAIKPAALRSCTQAVGILATKGTLSSELFTKAVDQFSETKIIEQVGHGLVQLIEDGKMDDPQTIELLHEYLQPMIEQNIDYLVLGCSHYPYLIKQIREILPAHVEIIDSGEAVARQTLKILTDNNALNTKRGARHVFYSNDDPHVLQTLLGSDCEVLYRDF